MYKNKLANGRNNVCGSKIKELRRGMPNSPSQRQFADMLQIAGLDVDKNAVQRIESGSRFVTDIELVTIAKVLRVSYEEFLQEEN